MQVMAAGWRWWLTDCHCSAVGNWQSTPPWCVHCMATADLGEEPPRWMGWPFWQPGGSRNEGTLSSSARARLVVLAVEVGGRFSKETNGFLTGLAKARARSETPLMQRRVEQAWRMRWSWLLRCAAAKAVAASLLEMQGCVGTAGASPAEHEVEGDFRYAGLAA